MPPVLAALAIVQPRAVRGRSGDPRRLDDLVSEIADEGYHGVISLVGRYGCGKSTALAHLAAVYARDDRLVILDVPTQEELERCPADKIIVASLATSGTNRCPEVSLEPWHLYELVEYLLATHPEACSSVVQRLGAAARQPWSPRLAVIVLDRFARNHDAVDPIGELIAHVYELIDHPATHAAARRFCFEVYTRGASAPYSTEVQRFLNRCDAPLRALLGHATIQLHLAADEVVDRLIADSTDDLARTLPQRLVDEIGRRCRDNAAAYRTLLQALASKSCRLVHPMAASIVYAAQRDWRPPRHLVGGTSLKGGFFADAQWQMVNLGKADLVRVDLAHAQLERSHLAFADATCASFEEAHLDGAQLTGLIARGAAFRSAFLKGARLDSAVLCRADFTHADLTVARLQGADLSGAILTAASLRGANLFKANLTGAILTGADLAGSILRGANLAAVDLRKVSLAAACLEEARLDGAHLEGLYLPHAQLRCAHLPGAHLTGARFPKGDLRGADLSLCGLAETDWQGADLRGANLQNATFHLGASRSGLVDNSTAGDGSKLGFFNDDFDQMHIIQPEEVRKANLRGADLRGARIAGVDFYLVDLRGAILDPAQIPQLRDCGAILG